MKINTSLMNTVSKISPETNAKEVKKEFSDVVILDKKFQNAISKNNSTMMQQGSMLKDYEGLLSKLLQIQKDFYTQTMENWKQKHAQELKDLDALPDLTIDTLSSSDLEGYIETAVLDQTKNVDFLKEGIKKNLVTFENQDVLNGFSSKEELSKILATISMEA